MTKYNIPSEYYILYYILYSVLNRHIPLEKKPTKEKQTKQKKIKNEITRRAMERKLIKNYTSHLRQTQNFKYKYLVRIRLQSTDINANFLSKDCWPCGFKPCRGQALNKKLYIWWFQERTRECLYKPVASNTSI
jgi:hypothetical protein